MPRKGPNLVVEVLPGQFTQLNRNSMNAFAAQQVKKGLAKAGTDFAKGLATAPFTAAPDILGLATQAVNAGLQSNFNRRDAGQAPQLPVISGDPIREAVGLDPSSRAGLIGEFADPTSTVAKGFKLGGKVVKGLMSSPEGLGLAQALFHGTPHKFSKFSSEAIGTGEGAQAFGHGLYFAESPGVARSYQSQLSYWGKPQGISGADFAVIPDDVRTLINAKANGGYIGWNLIESEAAKHGDDAAAAITKLRKHSDDITLDPGGHLYEVEVPDEIINKMLDWDAPLSEQPESVRRALDKLGVEEPFKPFQRENGLWDVRDIDGGNMHIQGIYKSKAEAETARKDFLRGFHRTSGPGNRGYIYRALSKQFGGDAAASQVLNEAGIPGIRFLDQQSRGAGQGTRNIVVFNPDDITQVKRDGVEVFKAL